MECGSGVLEEHTKQIVIGVAHATAQPILLVHDVVELGVQPVNLNRGLLEVHGIILALVLMVQLAFELSVVFLSHLCLMLLLKQLTHLIKFVDTGSMVKFACDDKELLIALQVLIQGLPGKLLELARVNLSDVR